MSMEIDGVELTDQQMAIINPLINEYSKATRINLKKMKADCLAAMEAAGCPLLPEPDSKSQ